MPQLLRSRRIHDHRIREIVCQTGNPRIFQHLHIPRSTTASWLSRGRPSVISLDWPHDIASLLDENEKLKRRTRRHSAIIRLLVVLLKLSGFRLDEQRLPDATAKAKVLRAVDRSKDALPLTSAVPPQNPVNRAIVDVSRLGVKLADPHTSLGVRPARNRQFTTKRIPHVDPSATHMRV